MAGHEVVIGPRDAASRRVFTSKKDAELYFREMLHRYRNQEEIVGKDAEDLQNLLERHPEAHQKIGCGVRRFYRAGTGQGTDCFWLERADGTRTDFSYRSCAYAKGKSLYQEFAEAGRQAVQADLTRAKKEHFDKYGDSEGRVRCEVTGERIGLNDSHLDHKKPMTFRVIVTTFIEANQIEISADMLSVPGDAQFVTTFVDAEMQGRFREYHRRIAKLRIIKPVTNLSLGGSERMTKPKRPVVLEGR